MTVHKYAAKLGLLLQKLLRINHSFSLTKSVIRERFDAAVA
jgi:hypothetical protein